MCVYMAVADASMYVTLMCVTLMYVYLYLSHMYLCMSDPSILR